MRVCVLRLERLYRTSRGLYAHSSFLRWLAALEGKVEGLAVIAPVLQGDEAWEGETWAPIPSTRLLTLPDCKGFAKAFAAAPMIAVRLARARALSDALLVRVPEHGNLLNLPLAKAMFGRRVVVWLVADRNKLLEAERRVRKRTARLAVGSSLNRLIGAIEKALCRRSYGIVNGEHLLRDTGLAFRRFTEVESATFAAREVRCDPRLARVDRKSVV